MKKVFITGFVVFALFDIIFAGGCSSSTSNQSDFSLPSDGSLSLPDVPSSSIGYVYSNSERGGYGDRYGDEGGND